MVGSAVMAVLAMPMRGIAVRFEGHEGIDLCCAKQMIVNKQLTVLGRADRGNLWPIRSKI